MRQHTYLNVILTVNACLLTGVLWTQIASGPPLAQTAAAEQAAMPEIPRLGIPNAAEQRQKMITALTHLQRSVDAQQKLLQSGKVKVQVTNLDELRLDETQP